MSFLPDPVHGKTHTYESDCSRRDEAMLRHDESPETEDWFFDATPYASDNEWNLDTPPRTDEPASAPRPCRDTGRIMVIGFHVIRV